MSTRSAGAISLLLVMCVSLSAAPQQRDSANSAEDGTSRLGLSADWEFESITLTDGTVYSGLIQAERDNEIEFVEIFRPPGKRMFAVVRAIDRASVQSIAPLRGDKRTELIQRFQQFRWRVRIEAGRADRVSLDEGVVGGKRVWRYRGALFAVRSFADEGMTRRCVVRVEQIFRAYRLLLPPRIQPSAELQILLFGSMEDYRDYLGRIGLHINNPAFFSSTDNTIVAGSELDHYAQQYESAQARNEATRQQYELLKATFATRLADVAARMRQQGFSAEQIKQESRLRAAIWQREYDEAMGNLALLELRNRAKFDEVTREMFARLYHEALHAYVENYVYSKRDQAMPAWLNEGLAQLFETGQIEADALRIDAPDPARLKKLQEDLAGATPLSLTDVLDASSNDFVTAHLGQHAGRRYLYSWGLAYFLAFEHNLLERAILDPYVLSRENLPAAERFQQLIGMPLADFEILWRESMQKLKPINRTAQN